MSKRLKGFTLIELLIVVAIIAILAAIAVPNFLEAQTRAKVSRVKADLRSLATGIESYYIDNNDYPAHSVSDGSPVTAANGHLVTSLPSAKGITTFRIKTSLTDQVMTLTTPVSYLTSYFTDPFADNKGAVFAYSGSKSGWLAWSYGPDTDEKAGHATAPTKAGGDIGFQGTGISFRVGETYYNPNVTVPSVNLIEATYDPSNGTTSEGDVWRNKQ